MKLMEQKETHSVSSIIKEFFNVLVNLFIFLPYFLSVPTMFKTLFAPWKNLLAKKTNTGFSFSEWFSRLSFNIISRMIGFMMRVGLLLVFFVSEFLFILSLPLILLIFFITLPLRIVFLPLQKTEAEKKRLAQEDFINKHMLQKENLAPVNAWFENYYQQEEDRKRWWELDNLFSVPPLARDWAKGYTPTLDKYTEELTHGDYQNRIKKIIGREKELKEMEQILAKSEEANVILVGEEGIGRHSIIDAFSKRIHEGKSTALLNYKRMLKLNMEAVLTQNLDQNQRENSLAELFAEASEAKNVILVIDNFERYVSSSDKNHVDLSLPIEKYAKGSRLQIIGITTPYLFDKHVFPNSAITQIFTKIDVDEVNKDQSMEIMLNIALTFESRYHLTIPYETIEAVIEKSDFYLSNVPFPEKAIELMDTTCSFAAQQNKDKLLPEDVGNTVSQLTHSPTKLDTSTKTKLVDFEKILATRIISQNNAINQLSSALRRSFLTLGKRKKPLASFLFLGPTGVGKTETAKALTDIFFEQKSRLIRFDMSLYQSKDDIPSLIGSAETQNPGLLTQMLRDNPYGVLLLDEIEKAHRDLLNIFLTMLDEGYITDGLGKRVDCKNLMIIATSNAASDYIFEKVQSKEQMTSTEIINYLVEKSLFTPEFLNRFDGVIVFDPLNETALYAIGQKIIANLNDNYQKMHKVKILVPDSLLKGMIARDTSREFGARNLERTISQEIEGKVAKMLLEGNVQPGSVIDMAKV